ncbi:MAG: hypothetical protein NTZ05_18620, partial [Chloroflexi bacterium]|nr:hypothetical protein [Chloroflexota bacterium]
MHSRFRPLLCMAVVWLTTLLIGAAPPSSAPGAPSAPLPAPSAEGAIGAVLRPRSPVMAWGRAGLISDARLAGAAALAYRFDPGWRPL